MTIKISTEKPPIYERCAKQFGISWDNGIIFAYGDTIHTKKGYIHPIKKAHEGVHLLQQKDFGSVEGWWDKYLSDEKFRLSQEIEAYKVETEFAKKHIKDRNERFRIINNNARDLSGSMYGNLISFTEAYNLIK